MVLLNRRKRNRDARCYFIPPPYLSLMRQFPLWAMQIFLNSSCSQRPLPLPPSHSPQHTLDCKLPLDLSAGIKCGIPENEQPEEESRPDLTFC